MAVSISPAAVLSDKGRFTAMVRDPVEKSSHIPRVSPVGCHQAAGWNRTWKNCTTYFRADHYQAVFLNGPSPMHLKLE